MTGKIIKGIGGFYYIHTTEGQVYSCRAVGIFRKLGIKPLVGDDAEFEIVHEKDMEGSLTKILPRRNVLLRPAVSNVDQAMIVFAVREPDPNLNLLDRFLVHMGIQDIPVVIFFNKSDLDRGGRMEQYRRIYEQAGYRVICGSTADAGTVQEIRSALKGKTTVLAGPSGVGKSSLTNQLFDSARMEVGELSQRIKRGRQTTRHTELIALKQEVPGTDRMQGKETADSCEDSYVLDTPGFTSLYLTRLGSQDLQQYFPEFRDHTENCRYTGCSHVGEGENICGVRQAVKRGDISRERYENYCQIYADLKAQENTYR